MLDYKSSIACNYVQLHFRYFTLVNTLMSDVIACDGLLCKRQQGLITSSALSIAPLRFEERRISIFGILTMLNDWHEDGKINTTPSIYRVLILGEDDADSPFDIRTLEQCELKWRPGWGGVIAFQTAIYFTVKIWEKEWNKVLDQIDDCLRFQMDQTLETKQIADWMFDLDFERSRLYFTILQILRIFGECIRTVPMDLRALDSIFPHNWFDDSFHPNADELRDLGSNWSYITSNQKEAEERLLQRLSDKTDEVASLRDGVLYCDR
jgi:hypothetical protein